MLEGIIGRGDRRVAKVIEGAWRKGARFDGWDEHLQWNAWVEAIDESGIDPQLYLGTIATDVRMPWDHLDMQLEPKFLLRDYKMSMRDRLAPPCGKPVGAQVHHTNLEEHEADTRKLVCYNCGVACDMSAMREERAEFLTKLGAFAPADNTETRERKEAQQARIDKGSAPHDFQQGEAVKIRLEFQKTGADAMTGHLDLVRKLPRILRRAGLPVFYTEGYHPKPAVSFGPALSLGVESVGELAEVKLSQAVDPGDVLRRLNNVSEEGLVFTGCRVLQPGEKSLSRVIARADYLVKLQANELGDAHGEDGAIAAAIERFLAQPSCEITVKRKKGERVVDVRQVVEEIRIADSADLDRLPVVLREGIPSETVFLRLRLDLEHSLKPVEVMLTVLDEPEFELRPIDMIRLGLWDVEGETLKSSLGETAVAAAR